VRSPLSKLIALGFVLAFAASFSFAASITATLDRPSIPPGETARLELRINGSNPQSVPIPNFPAQPNLSIVYSGDQNEYRNLNGAVSYSRVLVYAVSATAVGTYTIPAVTVSIDGVTVSSQPLTITATRDENAASAAFIRLTASKTNVYVGETFVIEVKVYGLVIEQLEVPSLKSDGFTVSARSQGTSSREQIGNGIYGVYTFPMAVAAAKAGNLTLGPAEALMVIRVPSPNRRRDFFDQFFPERKQVTVASQPIAIHVAPLPAQNVPPSFNGAIGNFQIDLRALPTNVAVGDPITLDIKIRGRGSFDTLKLPDLGWKDFTVYQPNSAVTNFDALGLQAVKSFDQVVAPQRAGITAIPPLIFSFFDPDARVYRTIQKPAISITVRATGQGQAQPTVVADHDTPADKQPRANDIVHIKPALGSMTALTAPLPMRPWFALLQIIPIGAWLAAKLWRKRANDLANNPRLRRQREVARVIEQTLPQLREAAAKNESERFFAGAFRLLQEQIGERLDLPAAAITEAVVDEKLPQQGAAPELLAQLRELFQACNQARYARVTTSGMEALLPKLESALRETQKLPDLKGVSK
jgi:hypothetical protein